MATAREPFSTIQEGRLASGRKYHLEVKETPYVHRNRGEKEDDGRWGIDGASPTAYVARFQLTIDGKEVTIPTKLFEDLSHVSQVQIKEVEQIIHVLIRGGDAAGAFDAEYLFKIPKEIERTVRMGEMPEYVWERTIWHNDFYDPSFTPE